MRRSRLVNCSNETLCNGSGVEAIVWDSLNHGEQVEWDSRMAVHSAMIDIVDQEVGRLISLLRKRGIYEDTVIIFLSDNGASAEVLVRGDGDDPAAAAGSVASYECLEVGWSNACNTPFRQHKMWTHEGGISTPLIVHWPDGNIARGTINGQAGHVIDLVPTIMNIVGSALPDTVDYPGESLLGTIRSGEIRDRTLFWEHLGNRAIRSGHWKAVLEYQQPWQLFDMRSDRGENIDLAKEMCDGCDNITYQVSNVATDDWDYPNCDVVFIDASHDYPQILLDIKKALNTRNNIICPLLFIQ